MISTCRLCTHSCSTAHATSIFSFHRNRLILDLISIFCPIRIERSDNLPQKICNSCLKLILDANELREKSVKSDYKLRQANFNQIETQTSQNVVFQPETENDEAEDTEMMMVKEENPLETQFVIKEITSDVQQEELNLLDEYREIDESEETGSEFMPTAPPPQKKPRIMKYRKHVRNRNQPRQSKYQIVRGRYNECRYKCPFCEKTFSETPTIPKHIRKVHKEEIRLQNKLIKNKNETKSENNLNKMTNEDENAGPSRKDEKLPSVVTLK